MKNPHLFRSLFFLFLFVSSGLQAKTIKVLFIGNSYTYVNDVPELTKKIAGSVNDTLIYSSSAPGGHTFKQHTTNQTTLDLIQQGGWDVVVLQEQSQLPSFPEGQFNAESLPYAKVLSDIVRQSNPCAKIVFYMTWGRKNGDTQNCQYFPPVCTYEGMDDLLYARYTQMADSNHASIAPVGYVWRQLRENNAPFDLYSGDLSHPSIHGSYVSAMTFYSVFFEKDAIVTTFNSTLSNADATLIKNTVNAVVFDSLNYWNRMELQPIADFNYTVNGGEVAFVNSSQSATDFSWNFGDGSSSVEENPTHTYAQAGTYFVTLTAKDGCNSVTLVKEVVVTSLGIVQKEEVQLSVYPNPAIDEVIVLSAEKINFIRLFDGVGKLLITQSVFQMESIFSLKEIQSGMYYLEVETDQNKRQLIQLFKQ